MLLGSRILFLLLTSLSLGISLFKIFLKVIIKPAMVEMVSHSLFQIVKFLINLLSHESSDCPY